MSVQLKPLLMMSTAEKRETLRQRIDEIDDKFLRVLYTMVEAYVAEQEEEEEDLSDERIAAIVAASDYKPMTKEALHAEIKEGFEQIERGEYYTVEELEKDMEQW